MAPPRKTIFALVISLSKPDELASRNEHFISTLRSKIRTVQASNSQNALRYLADIDLECVVVADEGINDEKNSAVLSSLMGWAKAGGTAVIACLFPSSISGSKSDRFFEKWGVPWKMGNRNRATFVLNRMNRQLYYHLDNLKASYSMEALCLKGVKDKDVLYAPPEDADKFKLKYEDDWEGEAKDEGSSIQFHDFPPPLVELPHVAAAFTRIGKGFLGYIGDVCAEEETTSVIFTMLLRWD